MSRGQAQSAFTLIEVIVVLVILGMLGSLVLTRQPTRSATLDIDTTVRALTGALQLARSRAIVEDRPIAMMVTEQGFILEGGQRWQLPVGIALTPMRIIFLPDGGSTGGTTRLNAGARHLIVSVNWLTGSVQVKEFQVSHNAVSSTQ